MDMKYNVLFMNKNIFFNVIVCKLLQYNRSKTFDVVLYMMKIYYENNQVPIPVYYTSHCVLFLT